MFIFKATVKNALAGAAVGGVGSYFLTWYFIGRGK